jgi:hypothetical protein
MTSPPPQPSPVKATIQAMKAQRNGTADKPSTLVPDGRPVPVQFNPTSLKLERNNDTSTGAKTLAQRRQQPNEGHVTLSLELVFDTAEGGPDGKPMDVRVLTAGLRQFAEPDPLHPKVARPQLRFVWGRFSFTGVVSRIGEELDYFDSHGTALRAKVSLSLTGQDEKFEANKTGPGSRDDTQSTPPGAGPPVSGPGAPPTSNPNQAAAAQEGESVQQLLTRLGADPSTWRSAMAGLTTPLGLAAGAQVQLNASISAGAGIGVTAGFSAGASAGFGGGLSAGGGAGVAAGGAATGSATLSAETSAGFNFSAQGGIAAATGQAQALAASAAVAGARAGFDVPGAVGAGIGLTAGAGVAASTSASATASASASVGAGVVAAAGASLDASTSGSTIAAAAATTVEAQVEAGVISRSAAAAAAAAVDPRAVSYGRGVPLRPRPAQSRGGGLAAG